MKTKTQSTTNHKKNIIMKTANFISATLFTLCIFLQSCDNRSSSSVKTETDTTMSKMDHTDNMDMKNMTHKMPQSMTKMMDNMSGIKTTGDFDLDFANMMLPHHQSAVDMAQEYLPVAKDDKIKIIAQNIIAVQKKEIEEIKAIIATYKSTKSKNSSGAETTAGEHNKLMDAMNKMMDEMNQMTMSGNPDKDFLLMMVPHHQSAVTMSEDELSQGKNPELKKMAQKIINEQKKEIKEFNELLKDK